MEKGIEQGMEKGIEKGIEQGIKEGVKALIHACREFNSTRENTFSLITKSFHLSDDVAENYMKCFWDLHHS